MCITYKYIDNVVSQGVSVMYKGPLLWKTNQFNFLSMKNNTLRISRWASFICAATSRSDFAQLSISQANLIIILTPHQTFFFFFKTSLRENWKPSSPRASPLASSLAVSGWPIRQEWPVPRRSHGCSRGRGKRARKDKCLFSKACTPQTRSLWTIKPCLLTEEGPKKFCESGKGQNMTSLKAERHWNDQKRKIFISRKLVVHTAFYWAAAEWTEWNYNSNC